MDEQERSRVVILGGVTRTHWSVITAAAVTWQGVLLDRSHNDPGQEEGNLAEGKAASLTLSQLES